MFVWCTIHKTLLQHIIQLNALKFTFLGKKYKIFSGWGLCPHTPCPTEQDNLMRSKTILRGRLDAKFVRVGWEMDSGRDQGVRGVGKW